MAKSKTLHGSRAQLLINGLVVGIYSQCNWRVRYDVNPVSILGRFSVAELVITGMEPVSVNCSGFRVVDNGPYKAGALPKLQDLLDYEDITIAIYDRQTEKLVMNVIGCKPTGFDSSMASRSLASLDLEYLGLRLGDEDGDQDETPGATEY
jgi:hypothetical protein